MTFGERILAARNAAGMTQEELAHRLGYRSRSSIAKIERGERDVPRPLIGELAQALGTDPAYLMGWKDTDEGSPAPAPNNDSQLAEKLGLMPVKVKRFPMLGEIACGKPIFADEDKESVVMADMDIQADFCLRAKGDSMINARIHDGDLVFIREMPIVENGEIAAVVIGDEATLKRLYYDRPNNVLQLVAENPRYAPLVFRGEELDHIRVLGKAVYFMSSL
ncbi:MAG: helix-turn-helix domain-containing protein [Ruminococcus sp.]|nr:helix-turn-helix domain-containing protein [Ruminococcus sp.]